LKFSAADNSKQNKQGGKNNPTNAADLKKYQTAPEQSYSAPDVLSCPRAVRLLLRLLPQPSG